MDWANKHSDGRPSSWAVQQLEDVTLADVRGFDPTLMWWEVERWGHPSIFGKTARNLTSRCARADSWPMLLRRSWGWPFLLQTSAVFSIFFPSTWWERCRQLAQSLGRQTRRTQLTRNCLPAWHTDICFPLERTTSHQRNSCLRFP